MLHKVWWSTLGIVQSILEKFLNNRDLISQVIAQRNRGSSWGINWLSVGQSFLLKRDRLLPSRLCSAEKRNCNTSLSLEKILCACVSFLIACLKFFFYIVNWISHNSRAGLCLMIFIKTSWSVANIHHNFYKILNISSTIFFLKLVPIICLISFGFLFEE